MALKNALPVVSIGSREEQEMTVSRRGLCTARIARKLRKIDAILLARNPRSSAKREELREKLVAAITQHPLFEETIGTSAVECNLHLCETKLFFRDRSRNRSHARANRHRLRRAARENVINVPFCRLIRARARAVDGKMG